jgi:hypothetical protein
MNAHLQSLLEDLAALEGRIAQVLAELHPVGSQVEYQLRAGLPTKIGTVVRIIGGRHGSLRIRLAPNPRSVLPDAEPYETTLPYRKIIGRVD